MHNPVMIETHEIKAAQETWGKAVVAVGAASTWEEARSLAVKLKIDMAKLFEHPPKTNEQMYDVTVAQQWERDSARKERLARSRAHAMSKVGTY